MGFLPDYCKDDDDHGEDVGHDELEGHVEAVGHRLSRKDTDAEKAKIYK